mmetsp:Transcript_8150/g.13733  ORF Transcript_8150/g.13733 Transcript_8150/m.13733 type:complete len:111 (-) Transcript_8150:168-500(-)
MAQYEQQEKKQQDYAPYEYQPQQQPEAQATSQYHQEYIPVADAVDIQPSAPAAAAAPISNRYAFGIPYQQPVFLHLLFAASEHLASMSNTNQVENSAHRNTRASSMMCRF